MSKLYKKNGKMKGKAYDRELRRLQAELCKLQEWVKHNGLRVIVILTFPFDASQNCARRLFSLQPPILLHSGRFELLIAGSHILAAQVFERAGRASEARQYYTDYLKILPHGPFAEEARKALEKLSAEK